MRFPSLTANPALWTLLSITLVLHAAAPVGAGEWQTDFTAAQNEARRDNRLLVVHFYTTWCGPCQQMERSVLHAAELTREFDKNFVAVKVNGDQHPELISRFGVQAYPSDLIIDPQGRVVSRAAGYQDRATYVAHLTRTHDRFGTQAGEVAKADPVPTRADYRPSLKRAARSLQKTPKTTTAAVGAKSEPAEDIVIGLDGYSPVALARHRKWSKGRPEFTAEHDGIVYQLASAEEKQLFEADPPKYAPRLLGCDAVSLWKNDEAIPGSTRFGAYFEGELFLFSSLENRTTFKQDPARYTRARHVLQVDAIDPARIR